MKMEDWNLCRIGDVCEVVKDIYIPHENESLSYIGLEHINPQALSINSIGKSENLSSAKFSFKKGQILFGKLRPYFRKVYRPDFNGVCSTDIWVINAKKGFDNGFLFYFFANKEIVNKANKSSEGTRMPRAKWEYLAGLEYGFPPLNEQKAIVKVLSDLDLKIKLLQKQNEALEKVGQLLFKRWFVDFEFPDDKGKPYKSNGGKLIKSELGEIPKGWKVGMLGDVLELLRDGTHNPPKRVSSGVPLLVGKNIVNNFIDHSNITFISEENYEKIHKNYRPEMNDLVFTKIGTLGKVGILRAEDIPLTIHCNSALLRPNSSSSPNFLFWLFKSGFFQFLFHSRKQQTVQEFINLKDISEIPIITGNENKIKLFDVLTKTLLEKLSKNEIQTRSLTKLRDTLLPKLMSGKVRVKYNEK
jgi:type I restriction enzyme, S subunit